ncbi:MAG TPA: T9SS type A sorting domain-containing protein [Flavipsychrobacter sp.]
MKSFFGIFFFLFVTITATAQVKCYRFYLDNQSPDWRDTSCVACTSDPAVIADVTNQLNKPRLERNRHINGTIVAGNALVNKNASHSFLWHFKVNEWALSDFSMEVCDGRPYSDVDADTAYWLNTVRAFCPWLSMVAEELTTANIRNIQGELTGMAIYPNPAVDHFNLVVTIGFSGQADIYTVNGSNVYSRQLNLEKGGTVSIDVGHLPSGIYILTLHNGEQTMQQKLSIVR